MIAVILVSDFYELIKLSGNTGVKGMWAGCCQ